MPTAGAGPRVRRLAHPDADIRARALGLPRSHPVLVVLGAGDDPGTDLAATVLPVLRAVLAAAARTGVTVVTAGADAGVAHLVGLAAEALDGRWPRLVGVAPSGRVAAEDAEPTGEEVRLNANHDTAVLVPGSRWGEELPALFRVVDAVAGAKRPALALLVGGDEVTRAALVEHLGRDRPLLVLAGTGGLADEIVHGHLAAGGGEVVDAVGEDRVGVERVGVERAVTGQVVAEEDPTAAAPPPTRPPPTARPDDLAVLVRSGQVAVVHVDEGPDKVVAVLVRVLTGRPGAEVGHTAPPATIWPRPRFRPPDPHPVVDPGYVLDYPRLADAIHEANQLVAPALHECEVAALRARERARLLVALAIAAGFATTLFAALQVWLRDVPWPGVLLAASGAVAAVLAVVARHGEDPDARLRAERLRTLYFDHLAAPPAADDAEREERARELSAAVARHRHEPVSRA
ncbi:hypothetical protein Q5530_22445 [Saccharothrix sp. BKS2]|uniref:hypothetical protein n=1 Tax=Saccharothrix sp. BKS2 TaxID=3064400 RepID=UPI0039EBF86F